MATKWAHAESITGLLWLPPSPETSKMKQEFVTAGTDGCVVIWEVGVDRRVPAQTPRFSARTISARFRKSMDDILRHDA